MIFVYQNIHILPFLNMGFFFFSPLMHNEKDLAPFTFSLCIIIFLLSFSYYVGLPTLGELGLDKRHGIYNILLVRWNNIYLPSWSDK